MNYTIAPCYFSASDLLNFTETASPCVAIDDPAVCGVKSCVYSSLGHGSALCLLESGVTNSALDYSLLRYDWGKNLK